jgi:hypothetical protein
MKASTLLADAAITFAVTLAVSALVTFSWNLARHGAGVVEWDTAFRFAVILGIALPLLQARSQRSRTAGR